MSTIRGAIRRNAATIALVVIALAAGTILYAQALATARLQQQVEGQQQIISQVKDLATSLDKHADERTAQIDKLNRHLDCIVQFFAQPNRTTKSITDIDTCTLKNITTGQTSQPITTPPAPTAQPTVTVTQAAPNSIQPTAPTPAPQQPAVLPLGIGQIKSSLNKL